MGRSVEELEEHERVLLKNGYIELRAVLRVNGHETELHLSNKYEPTWRIGLCSQETKDQVMPVVRRVYDAVFQTNRYAK
jgi:hypothetical protein